MINSKTSIAELGAIVCEALKKEGLECFLSGGAVVSIYTSNKYESYDLDFVSFSSREKIKAVMLELGFKQEVSRHFIHPDSKYFVEFPGSSMTIGDQLITEFNDYKTKNGVLKLLTPTDCVKDRLAAFYHWNDKQGLDQAVLVCRDQPVNLKEVERWSKKEFMEKKYKDFLEALKSS